MANVKAPFETLIKLAHDVQGACALVEKLEGLERACDEQRQAYDLLRVGVQDAKDDLQSTKDDVAQLRESAVSECRSLRDAAKVEAQRLVAETVAANDAKNERADAELRVKRAACDALETKAEGLSQEVFALQDEKTKLEAVIADLRQRLAAV